MALKKIWQPLFWCSLACYIIVVLCSLAGRGLPVSMTLDFRGTGQEITRYCFGYAHPNSLHLFSVRLMCLFAGAYFEKIDWRHICGLAVFNYVIFYFTDSRTGMICGYILVLLLILYRYLPFIMDWKIWKIGAAACVAAVVVFGLYSVVCYGRAEILEKVNRFFTGRLYLANQAYTEIGISLWGNAAIGNYVCDNGIMSMLLGYGVIPFVIYWLGMFWVLLEAMKKKTQYVVILILVFTIYAFMEGSVLLKIFRNIPMVYMNWIIFGKNKLVKSCVCK